MSPAKSKKQQAFMAIQYEKKKKGQPTQVDMTKQQLKDFASTPTKGLPKAANILKKAEKKK